MLNALLVLVATFQAWHIWIALPIPNTNFAMSVGTLWMLSLINDAVAMSTGISMAAMVGSAAVAASFAFRFQGALRSDAVSFPTFAWKSDRTLAGLRGDVWIFAVGTLFVFAANIFEVAERLGQSDSNANVLGIGQLVAALCLAGFGIMYVVRDARPSRNR